MSVTIWHNPRCSKSRATLQLLEQSGVSPKVMLYLETPPAVEELDRVLGALGCEPRGALRRGESIYKELGLSNEDISRDDLISAMVANPILIERPIVIKDDKAAIGRPPEAVLDIL